MNSKLEDDFEKIIDEVLTMPDEDLASELREYRLKYRNPHNMPTPENIDPPSTPPQIVICAHARITEEK